MKINEKCNNINNHIFGEPFYSVDAFENTYIIQTGQYSALVRTFSKSDKIYFKLDLQGQSHL
jgi:hypothetical protein